VQERQPFPALPHDRLVHRERACPGSYGGSAARGRTFGIHCPHHGSAGTPCYVRGYWHDGIAALDEDGLRRPLGPKGGDFAGDPMAALIIHINREVMHHGGEICLLRDLYRSQG